MWKPKTGLLGFFLLLLLFWPTYCLANAQLLTITEEQLRNYEQSATELQMLIEASKLTTNASAQRIVNLEKQLQTLLQSLQKASDLQKESAKIIEQQAKTLKLQEKSLNASSEIIKKLEAKIARLERNNTTKLYFNTTSAGIVQTSGKLALTVGQKYNGGIEVGGEITIITW